MVEYRSDLPELPARMRAMPLDERGYPVPWFVDCSTGKPDFRVVRPSGIAIAHNKGLCWLCGEKRGVYQAFVVGPMCGINRTTAEPPSHRECAEYVVRACPFLTRPLAKRNERGLDELAVMEPAGDMIKRNERGLDELAVMEPAGDMIKRNERGLDELAVMEPAGDMIKRNPGVTLLWITKDYRPFRVENGWLFRIGNPTDVQFWAKGRRATRAEVDASVSSGIHLLEEPARAQGRDAVRELSRRRSLFDKMVIEAYAA